MSLSVPKIVSALNESTGGNFYLCNFENPSRSLVGKWLYVFVASEIDLSGYSWQNNYRHNMANLSTETEVPVDYNGINVLSGVNGWNLPYKRCTKFQLVSSDGISLMSFGTGINSRYVSVAWVEDSQGPSPCVAG